MRFASQEALRRYLHGRLSEERGEGAEALGEYYRALLLDDRAAVIARRVSEVSSVMGEPQRALEFSDRALTIDPLDARAHWLKGAALINLGRDAESLAPLETAVRLDSSRVEYFRALARSAERLDRISLAARCWRHITWADEDDGEAWFQLATAEVRLGRFGAADTAMARAVDLNPLRPGLFFMQGWIAENLERSQPAVAFYLQHLRIHPGDQMTRRRLIPLLVRQEHVAEALREARILTRARPDDLEAIHMEAELAFKAGAASEALRLLDRLKRERPDNPEALSVRLSVLARHGRKSQALAEAEARVSKLPDDLEIRLLAARVNDLCARSEPAIGHLRRAVAIAPDSLVPRVMLARAYASANRHREAEAIWSEAVGRFPGVTQLEFDLAVCREQLGDLAGAEEAARGILRRDHDNATALNFLGYLFADHNLKLDEALDLIRRALVFDPDNGAYLDSFGWACFRLGRLDEARRHLERAAALTGNDPIVLEHLGDVYKELNLNSLAREQYRRSLTADNANARVRAKLSGLR